MPPDFLGAFTDDPADLEIAQRFCRLLVKQGLLCLAWPEEFSEPDAGSDLAPLRTAARPVPNAAGGRAAQ